MSDEELNKLTNQGVFTKSTRDKAVNAFYWHEIHDGKKIEKALLITQIKFGLGRTIIREILAKK